MDLLETHPSPVVVPARVITELCQLLATRRGAEAEAAFLTSLAAGEMDVSTWSQPTTPAPQNS